MKNRTLVNDMRSRFNKENKTSVDTEIMWQLIQDLRHYGGTEFTRGTEVMNLLYNRDGSWTGRTMKQVGIELGISQSRVAQIRDTVFSRMLHQSKRNAYEIDEKKESHVDTE